jgi:predicted GNAT superfamily acetyltransferase
LADLAEARGSAEREYTDVHGVCDIAHTQGLFLALSAEMAINPPDPATDVFEGVDLLRTLIYKVVHNQADKQLVA